MNKNLVGLSIVVAIFASIILIPTIYNFGSFLDFYLRCIDENAGSGLHSYYSCLRLFNDVQFILIPIALFGLAIWLGYCGYRDSFSKALHFRIIVPVLIAGVSSILTLTLKGIVLFTSYLECMWQCPTGTCGGATGTDAIYNCTFPIIEFALPAVIVSIVSAIIVGYAKKKSLGQLTRP